MLRATSRPFVCWRCALRPLDSDVSSLRSGRRTLPRTSRTSSAYGSIPLSSRTFATVQHSDAGRKPEKLPIRERLRLWEAEHHVPIETAIADYADPGALSNSMTRPLNVTMGQFEIVAPMFDGDELGELRADDAILGPGDLVEFSSEGVRRPLLAVCLGRINGYEYYYTSSGKWFAGLGVRSLFVVHNFATPAELKPIIAELPPEETPPEAVNAMRDLGHGPTAETGAALLRKMLQFVQDSETIYQANAGTLDASSALIGHPTKHRYLTLHEIADLVLPESLKTEGKFSAYSLYAVHRALLQDEVFFRPLKVQGHRRSYLFEISPLSDVQTVQNVERRVRTHLDLGVKFENENKSLKLKQKSLWSLQSFIEKAQVLIDRSRKRRQWSATGILGPSKAEGPAEDLDGRIWSASELEILKFMELWASYQKFPAYSRFQTLGSTILRTLERYQDSELLVPSTGWTFLQEVGWITPWEIPARYTARFPGVEVQRGGGYIRPPYGELNLEQDKMASIRQEFGNATAYCIDAEETTEIDDGVSLERTSNPEQSWIHVHVADPASCIDANTPIATYAELLPETIYLPGHFERMLPDAISQERFSLGAGRPCLTFSALVQTDGTILDEKITPGLLKDVVYMTAEDVAAAIGENRVIPGMEATEMTVGGEPQIQPAQRKMTRPHELAAKQKEDLAVLAELGRAVQATRLDRGATPFFQPRPAPKAYFDGVSQTERSGAISTSGDPTIRIAYSGASPTDLVENAMKLANEVAARWCHARGIPIPYRTQPHALRNAAQIQQYSRDVFYPMLKAGTRPDDTQWRHLRSLLGSDEISTKAGPHFTIGVDMYTKATSPLRRFGDLIVHWQVEAALLEEARRGESLAGRKDQPDFLPFTREELDRMLPLLRVRERQARALSNGDGADQWILQALVRAWRFGEASLPPTFRFTVQHIAGRRHVLGRLDWFDRPALLPIDAFEGVARMADVSIGDVFEVKIRDVNVHGKTITVEAVAAVQMKRGDGQGNLLDGPPGESPVVAEL
ncbi:RNB-domain-containing protein [Xylariomycetidae sp. FL0641]|nr:RNB-domain-containing protein [Xylariomycetidae sp. FL0641]